jgi:DNA-binding transcriptional ArsR family regulator
MGTGGTLRLTDPRAMRALAHPLRLRLLGELRITGPSTVGMLSETVDESPANVSYHLSTLAKHGFVVEVPERARDRRERWWAAAHDTTSWEPVDARDEPERQAASGALRRAIIERYSQTLQAYLELEPSLDKDWVRGTSSSDSNLHLTATELQELRAELEALAARWAERSDPDREGAEVVTLMYHAFRRPT